MHFVFILSIKQWRNATSTFNYFTDQGIPGPKPIPIFGTMWGLWKTVRYNYYLTAFVTKNELALDIHFFYCMKEHPS